MGIEVEITERFHVPEIDTHTDTEHSPSVYQLIGATGNFLRTAD
jgi:hypothetical protein